MLKELLVSACQSRIIGPSALQRWGRRLKKLFGQEDQGVTSIHFKGLIYKVVMGSNEVVSDRVIGTKPYELTMRTLTESRIQQLVESEPIRINTGAELDVGGQAQSIEPPLTISEEVLESPLPAVGTVMGIEPKTISPFRESVETSSSSAQPVEIFQEQNENDEESQSAWPPPVNAVGMIGQTQAVDQLVEQAVFARDMGERFTDKLLVGPAGVGKSSIARAIARLLLHQQEIMFNGGDLRTMDMLMARLIDEGRIPQNTTGTVAVRPSLIFIDEVHAIGSSTATALLSAMDDQRQTTVGGVIHDFNEVVFILATTDPGRLSEAFNSRPDKTYLRHYTLDEMAGIVWLHGQEYLGGFQLPREVCLEIAARMRCNPRRSVRSVREALRPYFYSRLPDASQETGMEAIGRAMTLQAVCEYYDVQGIDSNGLDEVAINYLRYLMRNGASAEERLRQGLGITNRADFIEVDEYLRRLGLVQITAGGRTLTPQGRQYPVKHFNLRDRISRRAL